MMWWLDCFLLFIYLFFMTVLDFIIETLWHCDITKWCCVMSVCVWAFCHYQNTTRSGWVEFCLRLWVWQLQPLDTKTFVFVACSVYYHNGRYASVDFCNVIFFLKLRAPQVKLNKPTLYWGQGINLGGRYMKTSPKLLFLLVHFSISCDDGVLMFWLGLDTKNTWLGWGKHHVLA